MNEVEVSLEGVGAAPWIESARGFALAVLDRLEKRDWDLSLLFCDDAFIRGLNRQYRDKDEPTDVLSFEQGQEYRDPDGTLRFLAGDIVISLDSLRRNALEFATTPDMELRRLIVHGILHLSGMDHENNDPAEPMLVLQESILRELGATIGFEVEGAGDVSRS